jgi:NADH-quinone oxidoreductase subunit F
MDLHVVGPLASPPERAAVDAVLGHPSGSVAGGEGGTRDEGRTGEVEPRGGRAARARRTLLLPVLNAIQDRIGHISQPALNYACRRLTVPPAEAYGVASFYALLATRPRPSAVAHVCDDIACRLAGAEELCSELGRTLGPEGQPALDGQATWLRSPCLGRCEEPPAALFTVAGEIPGRWSGGSLSADAILTGLERGASEVRAAGDLDAAMRPAAAERPPAADPAAADLATRLGALRRSVPEAGHAHHRLLARAGVADPTSLDDYRAHGGYQALTTALALGPEQVIAEIMASKLVGRGGAAFPTGRKWAAVRAATGSPKYVVCNADESEPGTFKDRVLLEADPFAIVEAMTIAGFAVGAKRGYVYVRGEYPLAEARLAGAVEAARAGGLLGTAVLGSNFEFEMEIRRGAGAYVCGEETALFESIEGRRGEPRNKPPYPVDSGLFGRPTAINNVETLANVPLMLAGSPGGGARYATIGTPGSTGPKLFCLSGHVARPGVYEVAFGVTLRELIERAGGVPGGTPIRAILLGGAAGTFVGPGHLDVPLTFEGTRAIGASLGSGAVMVLDQTADLAGILRRIARFFRDESCGQCVPCRVGTVRQEELLARLAAGAWSRSPEAELALLKELGQVMRDASICGLGQTASAAIESIASEALAAR